MITFKQKCFAAILKDRGLSGEYRGKQVLSYFTYESNALEVAQEAAGTKDLRSDDPEVEEHTLSISKSTRVEESTKRV